MVTFIVLTIVSIFIGGGLGWLRHRSWEFLPALVMFVGSIVSVSGFWTLDWVRFSDKEAIDVNVDWIATQTSFLETMHALPGMSSVAPTLNKLTRDDVLGWFGESPFQEYLSFARTARSLDGLDILRLGLKIAPVLSISLITAMLICFLGALAGFVSVAGAKLGPYPHFVLWISACISLVIFISQISFLDTLGAINDLRMRMLVAITGAVITGGYWSIVGGLIAIVFSNGLMMVVYSRPNPVNEEDWA